MNTKFETNNEYKKENDQFDLKNTTVAVPTDLVEFEHKVLRLWKDLDLVELVKKKNSGKPKFSFFDGPVTANNPLGVHHAWGRTLKDVVQRFKSFQGFDQRYEYGFDTQGLWVEVEVEKSLKFNSKQDLVEYGVDNFVEACKSRVEKFSKVQDLQSDSLGMLKSSKSYFTHEDNNVSAIWQFLSKANENGWLYKGHKPMPWCSRCGTSLSSHEQADSYKEVEHQTVYAKFPVLNQEDTFFVVWTTTPWTLPANLAVAVNPELAYGLFEDNLGTRYLVGSWLEDNVMSQLKLVKTLKGKELLNWTYSTAFSEIEVQKQSAYKVVEWSSVTQEEGTGVVHLAPGCGQEDFELLKEFDVDPLSPLDENGYYVKGYGDLSGKFYTEVNQLVVEDLNSKKLLFNTENYTHRYPHCWRCKTELVYRLVSEWFLSMDEIRPKLLEAADQVNWNPNYTKKLFTDWVKNMGDWCISRKRYWGLPLPFYECDCGSLTVVSSKGEFFENADGPVDRVQELHLPWVDLVKFPCRSCGKLLDRVSEVGDCWLDAGVMPFSTLNYFSQNKSYWKDWYPAEFVCEMREQVRLWFYSLMVLSVTLVGKPPFKNVLSYETVKDKNNQEMHKSGKNNVVLDDALQKLGADTLRLYYLTQSRSSNMRFDFDVGEGQFKLLRRLVHSFKFFQTYADLENFRFEKQFKPHNVHDKWMLSRVETSVKKFSKLMDEYRFHEGVDTLHEVVENLSSWYLRRVRERVWNKSDVKNSSVFNTLFLVFKQLSVLFASVTPFLSEVVYQNLRKYSDTLELSVHLDNLEVLGSQDLELELVMDKVIKFDDLNRQFRNEVGVRQRQPLSTAYLWEEEKSMYSDELLKTLKDLFNVKKLVFLDDPSELVNFSLKPNYGLLGPRFGSKVKNVSNILQKLPNSKVSRFVNSNEDTITFGKYTLSRDEVVFDLQPKENLSLKTGNKTLLLLDLQLTKKLELEGWLNDFSRNVQVKRSEDNLKVEQRVVLKLDGDQKLLDYIYSNWKNLKDELYLLDLVKERKNEDFSHFTSNLGEMYFKLEE